MREDCIVPNVKSVIRRRSVKAQFIITGVAFLFGAIASLEEGNVPLIAVHSVMALINILAAAIVSKHPLRTNIAVFVANAAFAAVLSYLYYRDGNDQMPYAWGLISLLSVAGCIVFYIRAKRQRAMPA
jgi:hypothetical protein